MGNNVMKQTQNKKLVLTLVAIIVVISIAGIFYWGKNSETGAPENTAIGDQAGAPPTYTAESEGQKIQVPEDVPKESIKNYELITENEQFKIRKLGNTYTITLYAIINRPDQYDYYKDQLREFKQNALDYLRNNNINPDKADIVYEPEEAKDL